MTTKSSSNESIEAKLAKHAKGHDKGEEKEASKEKPKLDHAAYEDLMKQLNDSEQKVSEHWDRILRMQADMKNAELRAERELANAHKYALDKFINDLLPVIDNLERAISAAEDSPVDAKALIEGVDLTLKMLHSALEKVGVKQVNPQKEAFNPSFHEAVTMQADASVKPGTVISVLQKGYLLNDRLVRPALVIVSK